ncbi:MAG: hypothetical protein WEA11_02355 [Acidimicrobiales bacterium]
MPALREQALRTESERVALGAGSLDPLGEFLKIYIESLDGIAPSTRASYQGLIDNHVCNTPQGNLPMNAVTAVDVESILSRARKRPGRSGSLLSPKTLRNFFIFLNSAFTGELAGLRWNDIDLESQTLSIAIHSGEHIKAVSSRLEHNDIGFTLRQYTHLMPENQGHPAGGIVAALDGPGISCGQTGDHDRPIMQAAPSEKGA